MYIKTLFLHLTIPDRAPKLTSVYSLLSIPTDKLIQAMAKNNTWVRESTFVRFAFLSGQCVVDVSKSGDEACPFPASKPGYTMREERQTESA